MKFFIDTNIIIYANDISDRKRQKPALEIVSGFIKNGNGVISTQVLQEFASVALTKMKLEREIVLRQLVLLEKLEVIQQTASLIRRAVEVQGIYKVSYWDACIIAAAESARCSRILSEDFNTGQYYSGIEVINPFCPEFRFPFKSSGG